MTIIAIIFATTIALYIVDCRVKEQMKQPEPPIIEQTIPSPVQPVEPSRGFSLEKNMTCTAYDLSIRCCGKPIGNKARGITKSGYNLNGKTWDEARTISSNELPLGTQVELKFDGWRSKYDGVYTVRDTGNMSKGVLDLYIGDFGEKPGIETINFGVTKVTVRVLK